MGKSKKSAILKSDKRIRLGIWGLGRGMSFYHTCKALNIDVVAGCDFNQHMRDRFAKDQPDALVTADADEFLAADFDAVLLATYCTNHGPDAIRCLEAGKHVLSEVTSFHTMAEGVALVEAVERSGKVYNLAENYPFSAANMYLARKWREGLFGDLMYAEYEYVHECRSLCYTYIDNVPVMPGHVPHNWRSWLDFHYYNTHSLGPMMVITGTRPTRVVSLPGKQILAGYLRESLGGMGGIAPALINMDNGAVVRNLMGATTNDVHMQRLWGTLGSAEIIDGKLRLRLGAAGHSPVHEVEPSWDALGEEAAKTGHGGGDFWVLYYFARQILQGDSGPFDIYSACDCTIPGILAYRSSVENGKAYDVPDFRDKKQRRRWRDDHHACPRYDVEKGVLPKNADPKIKDRFNTVMADVIHHATLCRAFDDWTSVAGEMKDAKKLAALADSVIESYPQACKAMRAARKIIKAHPRSDAARVLGQMLEIARDEEILKRGYLDDVKARRAKFVRARPKG